MKELTKRFETVGTKKDTKQNKKTQIKKNQTKLKGLWKMNLNCSSKSMAYMKGPRHIWRWQYLQRVKKITCSTHVPNFCLLLRVFHTKTLKKIKNKRTQRFRRHIEVDLYSQSQMVVWSCLNLPQKTLISPTTNTTWTGKHGWIYEALMIFLYN